MIKAIMASIDGLLCAFFISFLGFIKQIDVVCPLKMPRNASLKTENIGAPNFPILQTVG